MDMDTRWNGTSVSNKCSSTCGSGSCLLALVELDATLKLWHVRIGSSGDAMAATRAQTVRPLQGSLAMGKLWVSEDRPTAG
uniref:Uncharacterized protein n=1 Tax=Peronospora matthiolae TaxID=2874970 RepID=A0AAV1SZU5_9STRA